MILFHSDLQNQNHNIYICMFGDLFYILCNYSCLRFENPFFSNYGDVFEASTSVLFIFIFLLFVFIQYLSID